MKQLTDNILTLYGEQGRTWLEGLPALIQNLAERWELGALDLASGLSYNAVYFSSLKPYVLKVGFDREALNLEAQALRYFQGQGCVRLIEQDREKGALLIQRVQPGISLKTLYPAADLEAVEIAVGVMKRLHRFSDMSSAASFPSVQTWLKALDNTPDLPSQILEKAKALAADLLATAPEEIALHGDLHHDNIISQSSGEEADEWLAIDPHGVRGEIAFETCCFIRNPIPQLLEHPEPAHLIYSRIEHFARLLNIDPLRIRQWNYVAAVLSACWNVEGNQDPAHPLAVAEILACTAKI